ncbi:hypothetical protein JOC75_000432 [Metabacillus crassostreae]|nr:hypothetical protein [Metabacillus crassostreae]
MFNLLIVLIITLIGITVYLLLSKKFKMTEGPVSFKSTYYLPKGLQNMVKY